MSFIDYKAAQEYDSLNREEKDKMSVTELVDVTNSLREVRHSHTAYPLTPLSLFPQAGNDLFAQKQFATAALKYSKVCRPIL